MSSAKCTVVGFIRRLETKQLPSGATVCEFSIPVDKKWKDKNTGEDREVTSWMNVVAMGKQAEIVDQYLKSAKVLLSMVILKSKSGIKTVRTAARW